MTRRKNKEKGQGESKKMWPNVAKKIEILRELREIKLEILFEIEFDS